MKKTRVIALIAAAVLAAPAMAQTYVGASVGSGKLSADCAGAASCDLTGTSTKIYGGYKFDGGWAIEASYQSFGTSSVADSGLTAKLKPTAVGVNLAHHIQWNDNWGSVARLGASRVTTKIDASLAGFGSGSEKQTVTKPYIGLGVNYKITDNLRAEVGYDTSTAEFDGEKGTVRSFNLGVNFQF